MGRKKIHPDNAAKQAAYRARGQEKQIQRKRQGDYSTPQDLFERYDHLYHFTLDVCATAANAKCPHYFTSEQDGFVQSWRGATCWMNPPYHQAELPKWIQKAYEESQRGAVVVALLPVRTGSAWYHEVIIPHAEVTFLRGRVKFAGLSTNAREDSMIAVFGTPRMLPAGNGHMTPDIPHPQPSSEFLVPDPDNDATLEALEQSVGELLALLDDEPGHHDTRHPGLSPEAVHAIQDYQMAQQEYAARQPTLQSWLPRDRSAQLVPVARRLEHARARLIELHIDPATIEI